MFEVRHDNEWMEALVYRPTFMSRMRFDIDNKDSVVVKDLRLKDKDKDKDMVSKDEDKDKDLGRH